MKRILFIIAVSGLIQAGSGQQILVPGDLLTIQAAIDSASAGDTVIVEEGTYFENINFKGKAIMVASRFLLDGDTSHISGTIIDGSQATNPDTASTVIFVSGEDTTSVLTGFTVTGGKGTLKNVLGFIDRYGGGIVVDGSGGKIVNNNIMMNQNFTSGDGPLAWGGGIGGDVYGKHTLIIRGNRIVGNQVKGVFQYGGGIYLSGGNLMIEQNNISENELSGNGVEAGGGIFWLTYGGMPGVLTTVIIRNNLIFANKGYGNSDWAGGGGIGTGFGSSWPIHIYNNVIADNVISGLGGGIYNFENTMVVTNNTLLNNKASHGGNSLHIRRGNTVLINNILWSDPGNGQSNISYDKDQFTKASAYHNLWKEPADLAFPIKSTDSSGNLFGYPMLDPDTYTPLENSPVIGQGTDSVQILGWVFAPSRDYYGNPRPNPADRYVDIGAVESPHSTDIHTKKELLDFQIYPNPVHEMVTIEIPESGLYSMVLSDIKGTILTEIKGIQGSVTLSLKDYKNGMYLLTIRSEKFIQTKKIIKY